MNVKKQHKTTEDYRDLFDNIIDSVCILDTEGNIIDLNIAATELMGYSRDVLLKMNVKEFIPPDDLDRSVNYFKILVEQGSYSNFSGRLVRKDGEIRHVEISSKAFFDEKGKMVGSRDIIRDVTEKKKIEEALLMGESKFRTVVTNSEAIIFILDREGSFTLSEGKGLSALGLKPGEVVGRSAIEMYEDYPDIVSGIKEALRGKSNKRLIQIGELFFDTFYSPNMRPDGKIEGVIGLTVDITERIRKEKELELARQRAEEADRLKSAFLANISHEIRTPMNAILGFSNLLNEDDLPKEQREVYIEIIQQKGKELLNLLTNLLEISRIESGKLPVHLSELDLNRFLNSYFEKTRQEVFLESGKSVELRLNLPDPGTEVTIQSDETRLVQILNNLVQNAVKFTEKGYIEIGYNLESNGYICFYVKDTGIGIEKENLKMVFDRFRQVDESLTRNKSGTGLGLYIVKTLLVPLEGEIWAESEFGKGSTFWFSIPNGLDL